MPLDEFWKNGFDFENINKRYVIVVGLLVTIILIPIFKKEIILIFNRHEQNKVFLKQDYEQEYFGIVVKKGRDRRNHNFAYFQFKDSTKIVDDEKNIWKKISIGDSVSKKRDSKFLYIFKKEKIITINYDDIYKYRDSLAETGN